MLKLIEHSPCERPSRRGNRASSDRASIMRHEPSEALTPMRALVPIALEPKRDRAAEHDRAQALARGQSRRRECGHRVVALVCHRSVPVLDLAVRGLCTRLTFPAGTPKLDRPPDRVVGQRLGRGLRSRRGRGHGDRRDQRDLGSRCIARPQRELSLGGGGCRKGELPSAICGHHVGPRRSATLVKPAPTHNLETEVVLIANYQGRVINATPVVPRGGAFGDADVYIVPSCDPNAWPPPHVVRAHQHDVAVSWAVKRNLNEMT